MHALRSMYKDWVGSGSLAIGSHTVREEGRISEGAYAFVCLARDLENGEEFALKKSLCQDRERYALALAEVELMRKLPPHPNVVEYLGSLIVNEKSAGRSNVREVLILMELCRKGHLLDYLDEHEGNLSEDQILTALTNITEGVFHLHTQNPPIAHRDIKVENVLRSNQGIFKLCDFGSATVAETKSANKNLTREEKLKLEEQINSTTTLMYRPPEMVDIYKELDIGLKVDIWMLGCILYTLLYYSHPFQNQSNLAISNANYTIPHSKGPKKMEDLVHWMLRVDPNERPSAEELLEVLSVYKKVDTLGIPPHIRALIDAQNQRNASNHALLTKPLKDVKIKLNEKKTKKAHRNLRADPHALKSKGSGFDPSAPSPISAIRPTKDPLSFETPIFESCSPPVSPFDGFNESLDFGEFVGGSGTEEKTSPSSPLKKTVPRSPLYEERRAVSSNGFTSAHSLEGSLLGEDRRRSLEEEESPKTNNGSPKKKKSSNKLGEKIDTKKGEEKSGREKKKSTEKIIKKNTHKNLSPFPPLAFLPTNVQPPAQFQPFDLGLEKDDIWGTNDEGGKENKKKTDPEFDIFGPP